MDRKAISLVVAVTLLLLVVLITIGNFQGWFKLYSSETYSKIEEENAANTFVNIDAIIGNSLYFESGLPDTISYLKITDIRGAVMCEVNDTSERIGGQTRLLMTFDDNNAKDLSGYGNDGTIFGSLAGGADCVSGNCFEFDGIDDYIEIAHTNNLDLKEYTISLWIRARSCSTSQYLTTAISKNDELTFTNTTYRFGIVDSDTLVLVVGNGTGWEDILIDDENVLNQWLILLGHIRIIF